MIRFLINVPEELKDILKANAKSRGQTLTGLIRQILWDWVKKNEQGRLHKKGLLNNAKRKRNVPGQPETCNGKMARPGADPVSGGCEVVGR